MITLWILVCTFLGSSLSGAVAISVNYGTLGDNLPPPSEVISLIKSKNFESVRIFAPDAGILQALQNSGLDVVIGTLNQDLPCLAADIGCAQKWVAANVAPYAAAVRIRYITAGNEVIPGELAQHVLPAIKNLAAAVQAAGWRVPVSTAVATSVLGASYPPSQGAFSAESAPVLGPLVAYLAETNTPLLVNVYPYFAYAGDSKVPVDYALLQPSAAPVVDGALTYTNMLHAMVDAMNAALEKAGGQGVRVVVSETGWPSGGDGQGATVENAATYNNNVLKLAGAGTPRQPQTALEIYIFAMFNENQKPAGIEQNFGLFHPDKSEVYHLG